MTSLRRLTREDLPRLREFWIERWGSDEMVVHGEIFRPQMLDGFVADNWQGAVTFALRGADCEIISLDSLPEGQGIGSKLIEAVTTEARKQHCRRVFLMTTNDNLPAMGFYQKRGFELVAVHRGAVNEARRLKPGIPLIGEDNIPIRDEIELEMILKP